VGQVICGKSIIIWKAKIPTLSRADQMKALASNKSRSCLASDKYGNIASLCGGGGSYD